MEEARPLLAWKQAQLDALSAAIACAVAAWREAWGLPSEGNAPCCTAAREEDRTRAWQPAAAGPAGAAWFLRPASFDARLGVLLWDGEGVTASLAQRLLLACRADLQARVLGALNLDGRGDQLPPLLPASFAWSGHLVARLGAEVFLLLDARAVQAALRGIDPRAARPGERPAPAALAIVSDALAGVRLPLRAQLADCELDLAALQDLRVGDVVPLPHRVDAPVQVRDAQGQPVLRGYLARRGRRKALELAAAPAADAQPH
jgi:hypothetical protein